MRHLSATELLELLRRKPPAPDVALARAAGGDHAFISYSSVDDAASAIVREFLETNGVTCWIAPRDIGAGTPYPDAIMAALQRSRLVVLVLSRDAIASPHVLREVERAVSLGRPVVTLRIDDSEVTPFFQYLVSIDQWVEAGNPPAKPGSCAWWRQHAKHWPRPPEAHRLHTRGRRRCRRRPRRRRRRATPGLEEPAKLAPAGGPTEPAAEPVFTVGRPCQGDALTLAGQ